MACSLSPARLISQSSSSSASSASCSSSSWPPPFSSPGENPSTWRHALQPTLARGPDPADEEIQRPRGTWANRGPVDPPAKWKGREAVDDGSASSARHSATTLRPLGCVAGGEFTLIQMAKKH